MKITFKTAFDGSIHSNNDEVINSMTMTLDAFTMARDIAHRQHKSIFNILSHKIVYICVPEDKLADTGYSTYKVLLVTINGELKVFSSRFGLLTIENNDVAFTTEEEANELCSLHKSLDEVNAEINYRRERIKQEGYILNQAEESRAGIINRLKRI